MKILSRFVNNNWFVLLGMIIGFMIGYIHWFYFGCYWGTYPMSSELWANFIFGTLSGGFFASLIKDDIL